MTLDGLRKYIESVCLAWRGNDEIQGIKDFQTGNNYNEAEQINNVYPMVFYELPYYLQYNLNPYKQVDNVQFAFNVFYKTGIDNIETDHDSVSAAKQIGDAIVSYIIANATDFIIINVTAVSVREFTDDSVAGMRYEWQIQLPRDYCDVTDFTNLFDPLD